MILQQVMIKKHNNRFTVLAHLALDMSESQQMPFPSCFFHEKIFDFFRKPSDGGTQVPTWELNTRPGYINNLCIPCILKGVVKSN